MPFTSLAFQTRLILCRLRNERQIADDNRANEQAWTAEKQNGENPRAELEGVEKKRRGSHGGAAS
jgi:hypothetical protein